MDEIRERARARLGMQVDGLGVVDQVVGIGAMGTVYRASTDSGESLALKVMHSHLAPLDRVRQRFMREARILDQVDHPNSVEVLERGSDIDGEPYFAMEFLDGEELEQHWQRSGRALPPREVLQIAGPLLSCLHAYHQKDILHRDLKPANIFLTRDGTVKLLDFGIAQYREAGIQKTRAGVTLGTPAYMSPEQAMGKVDKLDARTDVFGVGAVMFELLSGRIVHDGATADQTLVKAATEPAPSLGRHAPSVSSALVRLVDRALAWDPADRFATAEEMRRAVEDLPDSAAGRRTSEPTPAEPGTDARADTVGAVVEAAPKADPAIVKLVRKMFQRLENTLAAVEKNGWQHPTSANNFEATYRALEQYVDEKAMDLAWKVRPRSFTLDGETVWEPTERGATIPSNLYSDGFRHIRLRASISQEAFQSFASWISLDPETDLANDDDLATTFWDRKLADVDVRIAPTTAIIDGGDPDTSTRSFQDLLDDTEALIAEAGTPIRLGPDIASAEGALVSDRHKSELSAEIHGNSEDWNWRIERGVAAVWNRAVKPEDDTGIVRATRRLVELYVERNELESLLRILLRTHVEMDDPRIRERFLHRALDDERVRAISVAVYDAQRAAARQQSEASGRAERILGLYDRFLGFLPGERFETLANAFPSVGSRQRKLIGRYLARHVEGRSDLLAPLLETEDVEQRKMLLRILARARDKKAFETICKAANAHEVGIRKVALRLLAKYAKLKVDAFDPSGPLSRLIDDEDDSIRRAALKLVRKHRLSFLGPRLVSRIEESDFDTLSVGERRATLRALAALHPSKACDVAMELLDTGGIRPDEARQETRRLALGILGAHGSTSEALKAAERAGSSWWWNSNELEDVASSAASKIQSRIEDDA